MVTRRAVMGSFVLAGCGRTLARRYSGWLFVASANERGIAVADLSEFRRVTTIALPQIPSQVIRLRDKVFVTCPEGNVLYDIDPARLAVSGRIELPGRIVAAAVVPPGSVIAVLTDAPAGLHLVDSSTRRISRRIALPAAPSGFDLTETMAAVTSESSVVRVLLGAGKIAGITPAGSQCGPIRFRKDGKTILAAAPESKQVVTLDAVTGALLTRLPLPFAPARFCPNGDGGQMFVSGTAGDEIAIINPYQNEVDQTLVAGSKPFALTVAVTSGQELLYVTNGGSGDLSIFDIEFRRLVASVHVGGNPGEVLVTPDGEYALVINRDSGDVAVVRVRTALDRKVKTKPLFTYFATARGPQSAAIIPASA